MRATRAAARIQKTTVLDDSTSSEGEAEDSGDEEQDDQAGSEVIDGTDSQEVLK